MTTPSNGEVAARLRRAQELRRSGDALKAELLYADLLKSAPEHAEVLFGLAELASMRGDHLRASGLLATALRVQPANRNLCLAFSVSSLRSGDASAARQALQSALSNDPDFHVGWLLLGQTLESLNDSGGALVAYFHAVTGARRDGQWLDAATTPPDLLDSVLHAIERLRTGRRDLLFASYAEVRRLHGDAALARVDVALRGHLRELETTPADERQRPKFLYFPGLPDAPFHDPYLQPWARTLEAAFSLIRAEALKVLQEDTRLPDFVPTAKERSEYVSGSGAAPSWEAFFFYRQGVRYDENHRRCPKTSEVLDSIELCRIDGQAPEILFSILKPGTHINPHHGVTNVRLVSHLALVVPDGCALNLVDRAQRSWTEGKLLMFDDTFLHEAWNRSEQTRMILLMDCWNPYLTAVEKAALKLLFETITALHRSDRSVAE